MAQPEVVIVGKDGTEHVFPPGFDPKRAADIVRGGASQPTPQTASRPEDAFKKATGISAAPAGGHFETRGGYTEWRPASGVKERDRPDNSLLGVPPELAITGVAGVGRAAAAAGLSAMQRVYAGGKAVAGQAAPALKYEAVKSSLEAVGVPSAVAAPIALVVAGKTSKAGRPRVSRSPVKPASAPASAPPASAPGAPAPQGAPVAAQSAAPPTSGTTLSPQMIRNQVGLAARRAGAKLDQKQLSAADDLVAQGHSPADAVKSVSSGSSVPAQAAPVPAAAQSPKPFLNAAELKEYVRLRGAGTAHEKAIEAIANQRALAEKFRLPSSDVVRSKVAERNATGRWPK